MKKGVRKRWILCSIQIPNKGPTKLMIVNKNGKTANVPYISVDNIFQLNLFRNFSNWFEISVKYFRHNRVMS